MLIHFRVSTFYYFFESIDDLFGSRLLYTKAGVYAVRLIGVVAGFVYLI